MSGESWPQRRSQGDGRDLTGLTMGPGCVIEDGVRIFHPETVTLGDRVYIGHDAILKGHPHGRLRIGSGTWIGQQCYFNSAGDITIGEGVGIGPGVNILTSEHTATEPGIPVLLTPLGFSDVVVGDGADIGVRTVLLPGCRVGAHSIIGAGAVVTGEVPERSIAAGVPARVLRPR